MTDTKDLNPLLFNLITLFVQIGWQQLGKMPSPVTGKLEKADVEGSRQTIDMLRMLKEKMKGNLTTMEDNFLTQSISSLQINYASALEDQKASTKVEQSSAPQDQAKAQSQETLQEQDQKTQVEKKQESSDKTSDDKNKA
ncbi:MAG: DUF1844 domain-containing protein [Elusimicrobiota bacterium]|jgi:hypothetical protein|nr:DUF1844 domain-containing protein [Elusimicrobiota bacterium]